MSDDTYRLICRHGTIQTKTVELTFDPVDVGGGLMARLKKGLGGVIFADIYRPGNPIQEMLRIDAVSNPSFIRFSGSPMSFQFLGPNKA